MIFDFFVPMLLKNWKLILLGMAIAWLAGSSWLFRHQRDHALAELKIERSERQAERIRLEVAAETARRESDANAKHIATVVIPKLLEQTKTEAWERYLKKYPRNHAGCSGPVRLPNVPTATPASDSQADSPVDTDGPTQEFVANCAHDAALVIGWQEWAKLNNLEIK